MAPGFKPLTANLAIDLYARLVEARPIYLQPALAHAIEEVGVDVIDGELKSIVSGETLTALATLGIRGERVFPVPSILLARPPLIAYYRMLLGLSQKAFSQKFGYGRFMRAEKTGAFSPRTRNELPRLCEVFAAALEELVEELGTFTDADLHELSLLSLGSTFQGSRNVQIGEVATRGVFEVVRSLLEPFIESERGNLLSVQNAAGRTVTVLFGADPDVRIDTKVHGSPEPTLAIEIKGGSDRSNVHNRAGEAEKSHLKARSESYQHRWTIISLTGVRESVVREESPSTTQVFDVSQVLDESGPHFDEFRRQIVHLLGLPEIGP